MKTSLPQIAADKLAQIEQSIADGSALVASTMRRIETMEQQLGDLMHQSAANPDRLQELKPQIAELDAKVEATRLEQQRRAERVANDKQSLAQLHHWLRGHPNLVTAKAPKVTAKTMDEVARGITQARQSIETLKKERHQLRRTALPHDELMARARAYVQKLAADAQPVVNGLTGECDLSVSLGPDVRGPLVIAAWLHPEKLVERIAEQFPPEQDRSDIAQRLTSVEQAVIDTERLEEALIQKALDQGQPVMRRPRADPRAVLGVEIATRTAKAA